MIFFDALGAYATAWLGAFTPPGRRLAPLTPRRLVFLLLAALGFALFLMHWLALALDCLLYPRFRKQAVRDAVFVVGVPRSGTTYLHRELAATSRFSTTGTWEVFLAPAICERRLVQGLSAVDQWAGGWCKKGLGFLLARLSQTLQDVHEVGLDAPEEDYLALLAGAGCFFAFLAFPQSARLRALGQLDALNVAARKRLLDHYHGLLQRHLYVHKGGRLLSKNAAFASWMPYLRQRYPDARFVVCVRQPATALSSQLSSLTAARRSFASFPDDADLAREFAAFYEQWYRDLNETVNRTDGRCVIVDQEALRTREDVILGELFQRLGLPVSTRERAEPEDAATAESAHRHRLASWPLRPDCLGTMELSYASLRQQAYSDFALSEVAG